MDLFESPGAENPEGLWEGAHDGYASRGFELLEYSNATSNSDRDASIVSLADTARFSGPVRLSELAAGDADGIIVIEDQTVILDSAEVEGILVHGGEARLYADDTEAVSVTANWILVDAGAAFEVGTENDPFVNDFTLTLETEDMGRDIDVSALLGGKMAMGITDNEGFLMARGEGSQISIHGADRAKESWSQLTATVERGDTVLTLDEATGWEVGDRIALAPTSFRPTEVEEFTIEEVRDDGREIVLDDFVRRTHYGEMQSWNNGLDGAAYRSWEVDMRGEVALLSRNVRIQGDEASLEDGLGAHTMTMMGAVQQIEGVEMTRVGQKDINGRYPVHWHLLGDTDGENQYLRDVSIHKSFQKLVTIHGTNDVLVDEVAGYDHVGHGIFFEDGSENDNTVSNTLVFGTKASLSGQPIPTDRDAVSSFWIENPNNTFIGNHAAGSEGQGFQIAPATTPHGDSAELFPDAAGRMDELVFRDNTAHSVRDGVFVGGEVDPVTLELLDSSPDTGAYAIEGLTAYALRGTGVWIQGAGASVTDAAILDSLEPIFFEQSNYLIDSLVVADSGAPVSGATRPTGDDRQGVRLYREGASGLDHVHFANFDDAFEAITLRTSIEQDSANWGRGLSFEGTPIENRFGHIFKDGSAPVPTSSYLDLDGSLTGTPGTYITPNAPGIGSFGAQAGAIYSEVFDGWLSMQTMGFADVSVRDGATPSGALTVTRGDGSEVVDMPGVFDGVWRMPVAAASEQPPVYTLDFEATPSAMQLDAGALGEGESVIFRIEASEYFFIPTDLGIETVESMDALLNASETAVYHDGVYLNIRLVGGVPADGAEVPSSSSGLVQIGNLDGARQPRRVPTE